MKILLLGSNGQLGYEANRSLFYFGDVIALDYPEIDFTKPNDIIRLINEIKPDLVYNAVAYTDVDRAEKEVDKAMKVNSSTPGEIANYCKNNLIPLIHFSTDYVFDGTKKSTNDEEDHPNPINVYGKSKLQGEKAILASGCPYIIIRTSWVYSMRAGGFVKKVMHWSQNQEELRIVDDQIGNPTWARTLALFSMKFIKPKRKDTLDFLETNHGIYHLAGGGYTSRYHWTQMIIENLSQSTEIKTKQIFPAKSEEFPTPAKRPKFSALNCEKFENLFSLSIPGWETSLRLMLDH